MVTLKEVMRPAMLGKALLNSGARFLVLCLGLAVLRYPAHWLRPHFYPDGLPGVAVMIILTVVLITAAFIMVFWVSVPFRNYYNDTQERIRNLEKELKGSGV